MFASDRTCCVCRDSSRKTQIHHVDGDPSNTSPTELAAYFDHVKRIFPKEVHMYSIDRPTPETRISVVLPER